MFELYPKSQAQSDNAVKLVFSLLSIYPLQDVLTALHKHAMDPDNGQFAPKPADIVKIIDGSNDALQGWLGPNEAWSMVLPLRNERESGVATNIMLEALNACRYCEDDISARMAFIEAYNRITTKAKSCGEVPQWRVSLGFEKSRHQEVVEQAISDGLITHEYAVKLLPGMRQPELSADRLIESAAQAAEKSPAAKKALDDIRGMLKKKKTEVVDESNVMEELAEVKANFKRSENAPS